MYHSVWKRSWVELFTMTSYMLSPLFSKRADLCVGSKPMYSMVEHVSYTFLVFLNSILFRKPENVLSSDLYGLHIFCNAFDLFCCYIYISIYVNRCGGMVLLPLTQNYRFCMRREGMERFPRLRFQKKPRISDPGMHHGTCDTHVPWCMSGSLIRGGGENVPGIPGACATRNFAYLVRGPFSNHPHEERSFSYKIIQHWPKSKVLDKCAKKKNRDVFLIYANGADCSYSLIF